MLTTIFTIFAICSVTASALTIAAAMLSSRISQEDNYVEVYEYIDDSPSVVPVSYSLEN